MVVSISCLFETSSRLRKHVWLRSGLYRSLCSVWRTATVVLFSTWQGYKWICCGDSLIYWGHKLIFWNRCLLLSMTFLQYINSSHTVCCHDFSISWLHEHYTRTYISWTLYLIHRLEFIIFRWKSLFALRRWCGLMVYPCRSTSDPSMSRCIIPQRSNLAVLNLFASSTHFQDWRCFVFLCHITRFSVICVHGYPKFHRRLLCESLCTIV